MLRIRPCFLVGGFHSLPRPISLVLLGILLFFQGPVPGYSEGLDNILEKTVYSPQQREEIRSLFQQAAARSMPPEMLLARLKEGIAKRVPAGRVIQVLRRELSHMQRARRLLLSLEGGASFLEDKSAWARTANLLAMGIEEVEIERLVTASRQRRGDYRQATKLYVSLKEWGLTTEQSVRVVAALLSSSIMADRFQAIMEILIDGRRQRLTPEVLVERISEHTPGVRGLEELREKVLYR